MAPVKIAEDYYAVLEVSNSADNETIKKSFRRLARLLHPDKNPGKATATASFQLLQRAYEIVSDPEQRRVYDTVWESIRDRLWAQQDAEKRQAEAAERKRAAEQKETATRKKAAERKRAAERDQAEAAKAEAERKRAAEERMNRREEETARQERLRFLQSRRKGYEIDIMEASRVVQQKKNELLKEENELKTLETAMQEVDDMIAAHRDQEETEEAEAQAAKLREQVRKEQEARMEQVMDELFGRSRRPNL
ncbi:hypothetical protein W97_05769 [Coniosporium apollinis CBS 100218]|uniref:J domain-containing protein n=1 Tax=Coniosporium apollinis (strain CBS 100218) TaxID=1168221 RepID=R7YXJ2_CONA1|nr:uncharacterized protein W97_05769 [Coniosporium apollinis CBS 100218]EON66524.1 hypothetical protein W97_05769 [Coniosporium apollinis CBS 100218]